MSVEVMIEGVGRQIERLKAKQEALKRLHSVAVKAAAQVYVPYVKAALPSRKGNLRRHVHAYKITEEAWRVKVTGQEAHLVLGDVRAHEIAPRGSARQIHKKVRGLRMQGPTASKRAIVIGGHPYAHAMHPAHRGRPGLLRGIEEAHAAEAKHAAFEVLRRA